MKTAFNSLLILCAGASIASAAVCFDYSIGDAGAGTMIADGSWKKDPASAVVEATHQEGDSLVWYPLAQGLPTDRCPDGDSDGDGNSDCHSGWNDEDMFNDDGVPEVRVTLSQWIDSSAAGWGYTNGGLLYILYGTGLESAEQYETTNIGNSITINAKIAAGKTAKVYLLEASYNPNDSTTGLHKANIEGTGEYKSYPLAKAAFSTWASNVADWTRVRAIAVEYEIGSSSNPAEPFPGQFRETLGWKSLEVDGSCPYVEIIWPYYPPGDAVGDRIVGRSVDFVASRDGLRFSNVGSSVLEVRILDARGRVVASRAVTAGEAFVSTEGLGDGLYVVRATDGATFEMTRAFAVAR